MTDAQRTELARLIAHMRKAAIDLGYAQCHAHYEGIESMKVHTNEAIADLRDADRYLNAFLRLV